MKKILQIIVIMGILLSYKAHSQQIDNINNFGKEFYFTIPPCVNQEGASPYNSVKLIISSIYDAKIEVYGSYNFFHSVELEAYQMTEVNVSPQIALPYSKDAMDPVFPDEIFKNAALYIKSDNPILVYVLVKFGNTSDGFIALPVSSLGKEYIVSSYGDGSSVYGSSAFSFPSLTGIVGSFDMTEVTFILGGNPETMTGNGLMPGDTVTEIINKGDVWMISSKGSFADLSGSKIISDKPVAVLSGNQCALIPVDNKYCDYIVEMQPPTHSWGKFYHAPKIKGRKYSPILRIYAKEKDTKVFVDHQEIGTIKDAGGQLSQGFLEWRASGNAKSVTITANKPISVSLYNTGVEEDGYPEPLGNPFQMILSPVEQYHDEIILSTLGGPGANYYPEDYICLIFETNENGDIPKDLLIGRYSKSDFQFHPVYSMQSENYDYFPTKINNKNFGMVTLALNDPGIYKISSSTKVMAYNYGFGFQESYGYAASMNLRLLDKDDMLPPIPIWEIDCEGNVTGTVTDYPEDDEVRSNLSKPIYYRMRSNNYEEEISNIIPGQTRSAEWSLNIIDKSQNANAEIHFFDMAGNDTLVKIDYKAVNLAIEPSVFDFGVVKKDIVYSKEFEIINNSDKAVDVSRLELKFGDKFFTIDGGLPNETIQPQSRQKFTIELLANKTGFYQDSIGIGDNCVFYYKASIKAKIGEPEIVADDIAFEEVTINQLITKETYVENIGNVDLTITGYEPPSDNAFRPIFKDEISQSNPLIIPPNGYYQFSVEFDCKEEGQYLDSIVFISDADISDNTTYINAYGSKPGLLVESYNWGKCRIHREKYPALPYAINNSNNGIILENNGSADARIIDISFDDIYGNAAAFTFDVDYLKNHTIKPGESEIIPVDFLPEAPGYYELEINFHTQQGHIKKSYLRAVGVAPKISVNKLDFEASVLNDEENVQRMNAVIRNLSESEWEFADSLTIFDIYESINNTVSNNLDQFSPLGFKYDNNSNNYPEILYPGEEIEIPVYFKPQQDGIVNAELIIESDALEQENIELLAEGIRNCIIAEFDKKTVSSCIGEEEIITCSIENKGRYEIITTVDMNPIVNEFNIIDNNPIAIGAGETKSVQIAYNPSSKTQRTTNLEINTQDGEILQIIKLIGKPTLVERTVAITPLNQTIEIGKKAEIRLILDSGEDISFADIKNASIFISFNPEILQTDENQVYLGKLLSGKFVIENLNINNINGKISFNIKSIAGDVLSGAGEIAKLYFDSFLPFETTDNSDIELRFETFETNCVQYKILPAVITLKQSCMHDLRYVNISDVNYSLSEPNPNPVNNSNAKIDFSIALEAMTELIIYDGLGNVAYELVKQNLKPGNYSLEIPYNDLSAGAYFYKIKSGPFVKVQKLIISK